MRWIVWTAVVCFGCTNPWAHVETQDSGSGGQRGDGAQGTDAWSPPPPADAGDVSPVDAMAGCRRSVNLKAVSITQPVPFDVVIVADNSDSLSWSRDSLSAGLGNLLSRVRGHEIRFFVLTTTQYGASSQAAVSPFTGKELVSWQDSVSKAPYARPVTEYQHGCVSDKGAPISCPSRNGDSGYTLKGAWQFQMPAPVAGITPAMTDAQLTAEQKKIADAVLALGGGGAQQEQPICTLGRYVAQQPDLLPKHVVFVVLTDEDDTSLPGACLAAYEARYTVETNGQQSEACSANCDLYLYGVQRPNEQASLEFRCVPIDDKGVAHPESAVDRSLVVNSAAHCATVQIGDCAPADLAKASTSCGAGHLVERCKVACGGIQGYKYCTLQRTDDRVDLCTQPFDEGGTRYANLLDYCTLRVGPGWGACSMDGINLIPGSGVQMGYVEFTTPLMVGTSTADMIASFKRNADARFGSSNYSVEAIVLDPAFACPVHPGQSYGANLRRLATGSGDVFPLCEDYAPALQRIESFGTTLIRSDYPLDLDAYEEVASVVVTDRKGVPRTLRSTDYKYDRGTKVLRFNPGALGAQDESLSVNVARYCEPIVVP